MFKFSKHTKFHLITTVFVVIFLLLNTFLVKELDFFGIPLFFALAFLGEFLLIIFLIYEVFQVLRTPLRILKSLLISAWHGLKQNHYYRAAKSGSPKLFNWFHNRFSRRTPGGLKLTLVISTTLLFFLLFLAIAEDVMLKEQLVGIDQRILSVLPSIRNDEQNDFFAIITFCANWQSIIFVALLTILLLLRKKQFFISMLFGSALIFTETISYLLKGLIGRSRPEQIFSLIREDSFSFPSGHAILATVAYGFIAYLLIKSFRHSLSKILIFLAFAFFVTLISLSRIYLGVHYLSDVLASITLGLSLLSIFIGFSEINRHFRIFDQERIIRFKILMIIPAAVLLFSFTFNGYFISTQDPLLSQAKSKEVTLDEALKILPLYSETLTGSHMEPISFIYLSDEKSIENIFEQHGWYKADAPSIGNILRGISISFKDEQYLSAPVTPSYINGKPHDIAFQQASDKNTLRQRHHLRLWKTQYILPDGRNIWIGTASFDNGIKLTPYFLPTHSIDPNIDAERDFIVQSLGLNNPLYKQLVSPQIGKNGAGDEFFTDGKAVIIDLTK